MMKMMSNYVNIAEKNFLRKYLNYLNYSSYLALYLMSILYMIFVWNISMKNFTLY